MSHYFFMGDNPTFSDITFGLLNTTMGFFFGHRSIKITHLNCLIDAAKKKYFLKDWRRKLLLKIFATTNIFQFSTFSYETNETKVSSGPNELDP